MPDPDLPNWLPSWLAAFITALGGIGVGGYTVARMLKRDQNADSIDTKAQMLIDNLSNELSRAQQDKIVLGQTIDRISTERNDAVRTLGKLEGEVHSLKTLVERLEKEVHTLQTTNRELMNEVVTMRKEVVALRLELSQSNL